MASSSVQGKANRLGDAFSQKESSSILASVCKDYDAPAKALKKGVESLHLQGMLGASYRLKEATAKRLGINGVQGGGDNCGMVCGYRGKCWIVPGAIQMVSKSTQIIFPLVTC